MEKTQFKGFPKESIGFFKRLSKNNDRDWFNEHRDEFNEHVLTPATAFVAEMGERLSTIAPNIAADPRTDKSIFRIHRDTRFSKDKSPYKTHQGIFFWDGTGPKMECPGFYFHLEPGNVFVGGGLYCFTKPQLEEYRRSVDDKKLGGNLEKILNDASKVFKGPSHVELYKRVPRGFPADHPRADLLKAKGVTLSQNLGEPASLHSRKFLDVAFRLYEKALPMHKWLLAMNARVANRSNSL